MPASMPIMTAGSATCYSLSRAPRYSHSYDANEMTGSDFKLCINRQIYTFEIPQTLLTSPEMRRTFDEWARMYGDADEQRLEETAKVLAGYHRQFKELGVRTVQQLDAQGQIAFLTHCAFVRYLRPDTAMFDVSYGKQGVRYAVIKSLA